MAGLLGLEGLTILEGLEFSPEMGLLENVLLISIIFILASMFFVAFYRVLSKRDFLRLDLRQYNYYEHPQMKKFNAVFLSFLEYMVVLPFLILLWFGALSLILFFIIEGNRGELALFVSTVLIISTRVFSYFRRDIALDVAKLIPFVALSTFLLSPSVLSFEMFKGLILDLPGLFSKIFSYFIAIYLVELLLRLLYSLKLWRTSEPIRVD